MTAVQVVAAALGRDYLIRDLSLSSRTDIAEMVVNDLVQEGYIESEDATA